MFSNYSVKEPYKIVITIYECFVMVLNCCMKTDSLVKTCKKKYLFSTVYKNPKPHN